MIFGKLRALTSYVTKEEQSFFSRIKPRSHVYSILDIIGQRLGVS